MKKLTIALVCMAVIGCAIPIASAEPLADYGDAPDNTTAQVFAYAGVEGQFPTLYATANSRISGRTGAHHLTTSEEWLNETSSVSTTTTEFDALITDLDFDDSNAEVIYDDSTGPPYKAFVIIPVHVASGAPDTTRYLNVLIDQNRDGSWKNTASLTPEWLAVNKEIDVPPGSTLIRLSDFLLDTTESSWMRVTLTRSPIDESLFSSVGGWDGSAPSGGFAYGETEDYLITPMTTYEKPPMEGKCLIKVIGWGPKDGYCISCGERTKRVGAQWTHFHVRIGVVACGLAPPGPVTVKVGPAWKVHGNGDLDLDSGKMLENVIVIAGQPTCMEEGAQSAPWLRFPEPIGGGSVWQDVIIDVDADGNCIQGCTADVIFRAKFPEPGDNRHWKAIATIDRYDPEDEFPTYVESDFIIADFEEAPTPEVPTLTPIGLIALMGLLSVVAAMRIKRR
ncbi:hypothetical protein KA005_22335 [bacterium]|nr:hypothetical protein [bacterium]